VIVDDLYLVGVTGTPDEADTILTVDADTELTGAIRGLSPLKIAFVSALAQVLIGNWE